MRDLIDGYNLMYALSLVRRNGGRAGWQRARRIMLDWLADRTDKDAGLVTVIFNAQNSLGGVVEETHRGLHVVRDRGRTADDLIEDMLRDERSPETLTVVSNDGRVRDAATRRGCRVLRCSEYIDGLVNASTPRGPYVEYDEKDDGPMSPEETAEWVKAFGG